MGQAKKKGSYEERKQKALDEGRVKKTLAERKKEMLQYQVEMESLIRSRFFRILNENYKERK